jgi:4-hydroxybenzoate polyprenyltransferase|tara:strand:- start:510 stop:2027 length:1518 start_codon:yes stop_codon:yes gene_type:complete
MKLFKQIINLEKSIVNYLENLKIPFIYFILTFFSLIVLRIFLEEFSDIDSIGIKLEIFLHLFLAFTALAILIIFLFYLLTKTNIIKVSKVVLPSFVIILLPPILDLILSKGKGYNMAYMIPDIYNNLILRYFTFFGDFPGIGVTPGIKIEIAIVLLASFIYFYLKNHDSIKSLFYTFLFYTLLFWLAATPFLIKIVLEFIGLSYKYSEQLLSNFFLLLILITGIPLAYLINKKNFKIIIKDIRPLRLTHFILMFILGIILGLNNSSFILNEINIFYFLFIPVSIIFAGIYSIITNNITDYEIDKISNKNRPLINSKINIKEYENLSWFFLFIALFYSAMVNFLTFFMILLCIGNYFLYSMFPLRLKRIPFFSKLIISLNSLILTMLGFVIITGSINEFPKTIIVFFLLGFTAVINFIDIKDYKGDKKAGIKTLPVILGLKKAKLIIGLFFVLTYLSVYFIVKELYIIPLLFVFGITQFYLINKKDYNGKYVLLIYLLSLILLILY